MWRNTSACDYLFNYVGGFPSYNPSPPSREKKRVMYSSLQGGQRFSQNWALFWTLTARGCPFTSMHKNKAILWKMEAISGAAFVKINIAMEGLWKLTLWWCIANVSLMIEINALWKDSNGSYVIKDFKTLPLIFSISKFFRWKYLPYPSFLRMQIFQTNEKRVSWARRRRRKWE